MTEAAELSQAIRRLSFRYYFLVYRQAARRVLDLFHLGQGVGERLAAAMVIGALFFLVILLVSFLSKAGLEVALGIGGTALFVAWGTSAVFVFGPSDDALTQEIEQTRTTLEERRLDAAVLAEETARQAAKRDELEEEEEEAGRVGRQARRGQRPARSTRCPFCDELIAVRAVKCRGIVARSSTTTCGNSESGSGSGAAGARLFTRSRRF
jgi:hypothetical protein